MSALCGQIPRTGPQEPAPRGNIVNGCDGRSVGPALAPGREQLVVDPVPEQGLPSERFPSESLSTPSCLGIFCRFGSSQLLPPAALDRAPQTHPVRKIAALLSSRGGLPNLDRVRGLTYTAGSARPAGDDAPAIWWTSTVTNRRGPSRGSGQWSLGRCRRRTANTIKWTQAQVRSPSDENTAMNGVFFRT